MEKRQVSVHSKARAVLLVPSTTRVKDRLHPGQVTSERKDSSFLHVRKNLHITQLMHWGQLGVLCLAKRYFDMQTGPPTFKEI